MRDDALLREKLDPRLVEMVRHPESAPPTVSVIVQTPDGLKDDDHRVLQTLGGRVKDDLHIINAFSADISLAALEALVLSPRVLRVHYDAQLKMF